MPYCFIAFILKTALRFRILLLIRPFPLLGSCHRISNLHVLLSYSFLLHVISYNITHLSVGLPIFWCPLTSIFHILITTCIVQYFSPNGLIISVSLLTYICHAGPCSYFLIPAFLNTHVSLLFQPLEQV